MPEILIIDDDANFRKTLTELFADSGYDTLVATNGREALSLLEEAEPDLVLCDWKMPEIGGKQFLKALNAEGRLTATPVIIMTAHGTGLTAMQAMQLGAYDFITKPLDMDQALATVARALRHMELQREVDRLRDQRFRDEALASVDKVEAQGGAPRLIGSSPAWIEVFKSIGRVASTDVGVLLLGESGTGKEVVARAIHENSGRKGRPFVVVNCAALPPDLLESELFGHERGAFTSAIGLKKGKFEAADAGSIFLDEIGEMPLALQPKLLRVLQEQTFERVGSATSIHADVRIIAATNRALEAEVQAKRFRSDLFYRLNSFIIRLPPLRERRTDVLPLAEYFLGRFAERNRVSRSELAGDAAALLSGYDFPGNVRELEHLMDRCSVVAGGRAITAEQITGELSGSGPTLERLEELLNLPFHASVAQWERHLIRKAMTEAAGNKAQAARRLGIHRRLLYEKLVGLGIE